MASAVQRRTAPADPQDTSPPSSTASPATSSPRPRREPEDRPMRNPAGPSALSVFMLLTTLGVTWFALKDTGLAPYLPGRQYLDPVYHLLDSLFKYDTEVTGHADFGDGRKTTCLKAFVRPESEALHWVNVNLGNGGPEPDLSGGMIPSVGTPFGMTRWTAQTRFNYVSMCPYNQTDTRVHGFIGTHQPAVWMGESGPVQVAVGLGDVVTDFDKRGLDFERKDEYASQNYYSNVLRGPNGKIETELSATSRVGHLRFTFRPNSNEAPYVVVDASRISAVTSNPANVSLPLGHVQVDPARSEIYGWNDERMDHILVGEELPAKNFKGYFVARFSEPFKHAGISRRGELEPGVLTGDGQVLSAYVTFAKDMLGVEVRVGVSFISIEQARRNLDQEIPDGQSLEATSVGVRTEWSSKLDLLSVSGATPSNKTVLFTGYARTLVYPYEVHENAGTLRSPKWQYYSGYLDAVVDGQSYSGYSIWDTFRATTAWQLLVAPERIPSMITSMLQDYVQGGWLPMWKNIVETNIMVGTHADSVIAQAMVAGVPFDYKLAWEAVRKDAFTPPDRDTELRFEDRQEHTPQEVRAGLTEYMKNGWVADDLHSEAGSRTLDYAYDDHAAAIVAEKVGATKEAKKLKERAKNYRHLWRNETGFMEARRVNGSWAGDWAGWTEGDHWAYSLTVMHDVPGLIELMGGDKSFVDFIDRHFDGGHNLHTNEPSHHIPYLYSFARDAAHKSQAAVRKIGQEEYDHTATGLSGNEDCGQMSAWYLFSALGFYPVDPASGEYVIGAPFFDRIQLRLPSAFSGDPEMGEGSAAAITVQAHGASTGKKYIKRVTVDGRAHRRIKLDHRDIADGASIEFEMAEEPQAWPEK